MHGSIFTNLALLIKGTRLQDDITKAHAWKKKNKSKCDGAPYQLAFLIKKEFGAWACDPHQKIIY